jgi:hypothetical protein
MTRRRWPLYALALFLFIWEPMRVANEITQSLPTMGMRGAGAVVELMAHALVAAIAVAAAWSLWSGADHGPFLGTLAILLSAATSVQTLYWSRLPQQTPPGAQLPLAAMAMAHAAGWVGYLRFCARE